MSFSRKSKRVAGPGFNINVRYDDNQVNKLKNNQTSAALISKGLRLKELWDVKEQELLVAMDSSKGANYFDGYTHCFSCANNWDGTSGNLTVEQIKQAILKDVKFVGVALTEFVPTGGYMEQGFVAQVGGVVTLINESKDTIYPGDKVMLDVNITGSKRMVREKGIPREKIRFTVCPAKTTDDAIKDALKGLQQAQGPNTSKIAQWQRGQTAATGSTAAITKEKKRLQKLIDAEKAKKASTILDPANAKLFLQQLRKINERVIGKAYSFARPGDRLEVGLQPRSEF